MANAIESTPKEVETEKKLQHETPLESLASICSVLAVGLFVMTFIFQNFEIPSASMVKTLLIGDHVLVDRIALAPPAKWAPFVYYREVRHNDIIVFLKPGEPDLFLVKRAIGLPGDRIRLEHGIVYLNGVAQNEPHAGKPVSDGDPQHEYNAFRDDFPAVSPDPVYGVTASWQYELPNHIKDGELVVPPGRIFAMGDNRDSSLDSRYWGFVPRENIIGKPLIVYWSYDAPTSDLNTASISVSHVVDLAENFFSKTRWKRSFMLIHGYPIK